MWEGPLFPINFRCPQNFWVKKVNFEFRKTINEDFIMLIILVLTTYLLCVSPYLTFSFLSPSLSDSLNHSWYFYNLRFQCENFHRSSQNRVNSPRKPFGLSTNGNKIFNERKFWNFLGKTYLLCRFPPSLSIPSNSSYTHQHRSHWSRLPDSNLL